ncbi:MAG: class I SAM-dependent methyltransferase [Planctomycetota bacterium]
MTRRISRTQDFEINLHIKNENFISTPRKTQRDWVLNRAMKEFTSELVHLDQIALQFVAGADAVDGLKDRKFRDLNDDEIMEDWQIPVMAEMAKIVTEKKGKVLEIGFGRGVASDLIQAACPESHTIIECNPSVIKRYELWKKQFEDRNICLVPGMWQDVIEELGQFDGIFFHTYPLSEIDFVEQVVKSATFAEHFFKVASRHLNPGGVFTYLTNESDSLSREHQRALLREFLRFEVSVVDNLGVPQDTKDAMWADSMVIVEARN